MMNSTKGFTLTELLMSMGIISLLVGISIPALKGARESGRNASCQGNLRNWGIAYNIARDGLATISKPYQQWESPKEMLGCFLGSAPPRIIREDYERKKPWRCLSDDRESQEINEQDGISYFLTTFNEMYSNGVRNEGIREQKVTRHVISSDIDPFHDKSTNCVFSDGSVERGTWSEDEW